MNMILKERAEPFLLDYIIGDFSNIVKKLEYDDIYSKKLLENLQKRKKKTKGDFIECHYKQRGAQGLGRYMAEDFSLQNMARPFRNTLAQREYIDVDLKNSLWSILLSECENNSLKCENIKKLVDNRQEYFDIIKKHCNIKNNDGAKEYLIKFANTYNSTSKNLELQNLKIEVKALTEWIYKNNVELVKNVKKDMKQKKQDFNEEGKVLAHYYHEIESKILIRAVGYLQSKNHEIGCLIHDGFLLKRDPLIDDDLLILLNSHIKEHCGYKVEFAFKKFNDILEVPGNILKMTREKINEEKRERYEELKTIIEKQLFRIETPGIYIKYTNGREEQLKLNAIKDHYMDWEEAEGQMFYIHCPKGKSFIENYILDYTKKRYTYIDFIPFEDCPENIYNKFKGLRVVNLYNKLEDKSILKTQNIQLQLKILLAHFHNLVDDGSDIVEESYNYVLQWMSHCVINLGKPTGILPIFKSMEGMGKNQLFSDLIGKSLIGDEYYLFTAKPHKDIFGNFNSLTESKLLMCLDEANGEETKAFYEELKSMTTNTKQNINKKHQAQYEQNSYDNKMATTNNELVFKIGENNRRFACFECTKYQTELPDRHEYFEPIYEAKKNDLVIMALYEHLKEIFNPNFDFIKIPQTPLYIRSKEGDESPHYSFFNYILANIEDISSISILKRGDFSGMNRITLTNFYKVYSLFLANNDMNYEIKQIFINKLNQCDFIKKVHCKEGSDIRFNVDEMKDYLIKHKKYRPPMNDYESEDSEEESENN